MSDSAMVGQRPHLSVFGTRIMDVATCDLHWFCVSICACSWFQFLQTFDKHINLPHPWCGLLGSLRCSV